jgi:2-polyprenyl-3-methyl-5-hydroxy-6-metoxy-1,4-benzoquinol methylase
MSSKKEHWDKIFRSTEEDRLGWYESDPRQTMELLERIPNWKESTMFIAGGGTSRLIDYLAENGVNLVVNDISSEALHQSHIRLKDKSVDICWNCADLSEIIEANIPKVDIWIDRAVLHFITDEKGIENYFENVLKHVKTGGFAIFAEFSKEGALKCAGLNVNRYSAKEISNRLGSSFEMIASCNHVYVNPNGEPRPYIYALYKRN